MRKLALVMTAIVLVPVFSGAALSSERPDHFKGKPSETLAAALLNFRDHNKELGDILDKNDLSPRRMVEIHELTYTLENALNKIRSELDGLAAMLEEVHLASEQTDTHTVQSTGSAYLKMADEIIRAPRAPSQASNGEGQ
ncbi:hypothetical protein G3T16_01045 [Kineobactrum salinum]|uniref:Uncharacterized protein n=2 Tax=Kineobactrum salinum TaxID=2708301 RepID=A0A6C0U5N9_9GAMM|nr:hypothetical protein G3T16_01045 [Kineobactrum salinum]